HELERRVVHWEDGPHRAGLLAARPLAGSVPSLLRHPERDEGELDLAGFEQLDVLGWSFGWSHENRDIKLAGQQLHEAVPIIVVGRGGWCRADREGLGPVCLARPSGVGQGEDSGEDSNDAQGGDAHGSFRLCDCGSRSAQNVTGLGGPAALTSSSTRTCSGVSASASVSWFRWGCIFFMSSAPSQRDTTTVATPLPIRLVRARASDMNRSTPRMSAMLATGIWPTEERVAASTMKPEPVTPAAPFEVNSRTPMMPSC